MRKARTARRKKGKASAARRAPRKPARGAKRAKAAARKPAAKAAPRPAAAASAGGPVKELGTELAGWRSVPSQLPEQLRQRDSSTASEEKEVLDLRKKVEELTQAQKGEDP